MRPDTSQPWSGLPQDLRSLVAAMSGRLELLQRQILRTHTLTTLERDLMLGTLAAVRGDLEHLTRQLTLVAGESSAP